MLDNDWVPARSHAMIALRRTRMRVRARRTAARWGRRAFGAIRVAPLAVQIAAGTVLLVTAWAAVNGVVQVVRKPTEVFAVSGSRAKVPAQTWREYGPL